MISKELHDEINQYLEKKLDKVLNEDCSIAQKKNQLWFAVQCIMYTIHDEKNTKFIEPDEHS